MRFSRALARVVAAAILPSVITGAGRAEDLGVVGPTYPIAECDAIVMLKSRLAQLQRSGKLQAIEAAARQRALAGIKTLPPVPNITTATEYAQRSVDPTVTYEHSITNDEGAVIVPAGTSINPLKIDSLTKRLVFFDGRDPDQVYAVRALVERYHAGVKPILVAGSWFDLTKAWKSQVFFDQHGTLAKRFGIERVPSVISQRGDMLLLEEEPAKQLR
jgi:conjugal transfer pilus assembly protein TraW